MNIYIPTRGRAGQQITYENLPIQLQKNTTLVIDFSERHAYNKFPSVLTLPPKFNTIGKVRQAICDWHDVKRFGPCLLMMDDDLCFYRRRTDEPDKFANLGPIEMAKFMAVLEKKMKTYAHAGMLAREGGNRITQPFKECTRLLRVLAYNVEIMRKHDVRFDRLIVMEDFDVALQLLRLGYPNVALCEWVHNQIGSGAAGGCSLYRTLEKQTEGAHGLKRNHPDFVKLVEKTTKTAWNGTTRTDVIVQWKAAYESSQRSEHV